MLASPAAAQSVDLAENRSPGSRATIVSTTDWALDPIETQLPLSSYVGSDEPRVTVAVREERARSADALTTTRGEVSWRVGGDDVLFGRVEKLTSDEVFPDQGGPVLERAFRVTKLQAGYARHVAVSEDVSLTVGGSAAAFSTPDLLDGSYGDDRVGYTVFARINLGR